MKVSIQIPCFGGFYDSIWSAREDDELDYVRDELGMEHWEGWEVDHEAYEQAVAEAYADLYLDRLNCALGLHLQRTKKSVEVVSPREYNFMTDRIFVEVEFKEISIVKTLMKESRVALTKIIFKRHTSYSGFISFMSNRFDEWYKEYLHYGHEDFGLYLTYVLYYLLGIKDTFDLDEEFWDYIDVYPVAHPATEKAKEEYEKYQIVEATWPGRWDADKYADVDVAELKRRVEEYEWNKKHQLSLW